MPRPTRSSAKQPARRAARSATGRKTAKVTKSTARSKKATTARRAPAKTTAKRKRATTAAPPKTAARSRRATKAVKATKAPAGPAKRLTKAPTKATAKAPAKVPAKAPAKPAKRVLKPEDKKFHQEQKELLLAERATYTQQAETLKAEADRGLSRIGFIHVRICCDRLPVARPWLGLFDFWTHDNLNEVCIRATLCDAPNRPRG